MMMKKRRTRKIHIAGRGNTSLPMTAMPAMEIAHAQLVTLWLVAPLTAMKC